MPHSLASTKIVIGGSDCYSVGMKAAQKEAFEFLDKHTVMVLSTINEKGDPWGSAVYYAVSEDLDFYFMSHADTAKNHNLHDDPKVALTIVDDVAQITVQVAGEAQELTDTHEESTRAFQMLATIHPPKEVRWNPPVSKMNGSEIMLFKVTPKTLILSKFKTKHQPPKADIIEVI